MGRLVLSKVARNQQCPTIKNRLLKIAWGSWQSGMTQPDKPFWNWPPSGFTG
jgi:hypothetical protein